MQKSAAIRSLIALAVLALLLGGCASTHYNAYEGGGVREGTGGTKKVVDGIDIWNDGTPPRRYRIVGIIDDVRGAGWIAQAGYLSGLASKAKAAGGDAVILLGGNLIYAGSQQTGDTSQALYSQASKAEVIKYVK